MVLAAISWYSVGPIIALHSRIIARKYVDRLGDQVHPMIQTYANKDVVLQGDNSSILRVATLQSCFEEHDGELQHLPCPTHSPALNTIEPLWSVF
jgi:hypothetical protein